MPTQTFYNLPDEKRSLIEESLIELFNEFHISQVKVAQVVEATGISRAAFYKYFVNLEDAHRYIVQKFANKIHHDILDAVMVTPDDIFFGLKEYLVSSLTLDRMSQEFKGLHLLIKGETTTLYKRPTVDESKHFIGQWMRLLQQNKFTIQTTEEAHAFLFFLMDLVTDSITAAIVNEWSKEELIADFDFRTKWLVSGLK